MKWATQARQRMTPSSRRIGGRRAEGINRSSVRDKTRFLIFISLWTFLFSIGYLVLAFVAAGSFFASIASHAVYGAVTWLMWLIISASFTSTLNGGLSCDPGFSALRSSFVRADVRRHLRPAEWPPWHLMAPCVYLSSGLTDARRVDPHHLFAGLRWLPGFQVSSVWQRLGCVGAPSAG